MRDRVERDSHGREGSAAGARHLGPRREARGEGTGGIRQVTDVNDGRPRSDDNI